MTPRQSASSPQAGESFADLLSAATVIRFPVQAASAPKEQSGQGSSYGAVAPQAEEQAASVQSKGSLSTIAFPFHGDGNESVTRGTTGDQDKSNGKAGHAASSQSSISHVDGTDDSTRPIPQIVETSSLSADQLQGQRSDQLESEGNLAAKGKSTNVQVSKVGSEQAESEHVQPASIGTALETNKVSENLTPLIKALDTADGDDSDAAAESTDLQSFAAGTIPSTNAVTLSQPLAFSMLTAPGDKQGEIGFAGNTTQKIEIGSTSSESQGPVNAPGSGAGKTGDSTNSAGDAPTHSAQGTPADSSQNSAATQRVADIPSSHPNAQIAVSQFVSSVGTTAPRIADAPGETSHSGAMRQAAPSIDADGNPAMPTSAMSDARLMQTVNESEMRIGLSSNAFGDISIRTSISGHQLVAQISVDHSELGQAMSAQVSSVQTKLGDEHGLHALIEINNHASLQSGDGGSSSQRERGSPTATMRESSVEAQGEERSSMGRETILITGNESRLDIRA